MSFRNIFVVHCEENSINSVIEKIRCFLAKLNYGVIYRPENYQDELISKIKDVYFGESRPPISAVVGQSSRRL